MVGVVVARDDALPGVQPQPDTLLGAQPDRTGIRVDRAGHRDVREGHPDRTRVELDVDPLDRLGRAEIDGRRARIQLEPEVCR